MVIVTKSKIMQLSSVEMKKLEDWLDKDGICRFPENVQAFPTGLRLNGLPPEFWKTANEAAIREAIDNGWILFIDGNGNAMTKKEYMAKYPTYPDPEVVLRLKKKLPPGEKTFFVISRR